MTFEFDFTPVYAGASLLGVIAIVLILRLTSKDNQKRVLRTKVAIVLGVLFLVLLVFAVINEYHIRTTGKPFF